MEENEDRRKSVCVIFGIQDLLGRSFEKIYSKKIRDTFFSIASTKINPRLDRCVVVSSNLINYVVATTLCFDRCNYSMVEDPSALTLAIRFFAYDTSRDSPVTQENASLVLIRDNLPLVFGGVVYIYFRLN